VTAGQQIGKIGRSGNTTGPHLHYAVYVGGSPVNPQTYLP
jgi:murein DD-endopeptidase MepM/ murein hydrolase activator NlpD